MVYTYPLWWIIFPWLSFLILEWFFSPLAQQPPSASGPSYNQGFTNTDIQAQNTHDRTPLYEWSARRWDLHLKMRSTNKRPTHAPGGLTCNPCVRANQALDCAAPGIGHFRLIRNESKVTRFSYVSRARRLYRKFENWSKNVTNITWKHYLFHCV